MESSGTGCPSQRAPHPHSQAGINSYLATWHAPGLLCLRLPCLARHAPGALLASDCAPSSHVHPFTRGKKEKKKKRKKKAPIPQSQYVSRGGCGMAHHAQYQWFPGEVGEDVPFCKGTCMATKHMRRCLAPVTSQPHE